MLADTKTTQEVEIVVNGRTKTVTKGNLTFDELVYLAFDPVPSGPDTLFTITYRRGQGSKPEGTVVQGEVLKAKEGMLVHVTATDKS